MGSLLPFPFEFTFQLFPSKFGLSMLVQPAGAFLVMGVMLAAIVAYQNYKSYQQKIKGARK